MLVCLVLLGASVTCGPPEGAQLEEGQESARASRGRGEDPCEFSGGEAARLDPRRALSGTAIERLERCAADHPERTEALVEAFLRAVAREGSGAPPWQEGVAHVLHRGSTAGLTVSGGFDGWPAPGRRTFRPIPGTDLSVAEVPVAAGERVAYKLTRVLPGGGVEWLDDPLNAWVTWDGISRGGRGTFNNEIVGPEHVPAHSLIHRARIGGREVYLQLPLEHFAPDGGRGLGVLYVQDGVDMLTRAGLQAVVDRTLARGEAGPVAVAYLDLPSPDVRESEYTYEAPGARGRAYVDLVADTIVPEIERGLRLASMPENRGLAGASLGGLISFYGVWTRDDVFRLVGAQSASLFWNGEDMWRRVVRGPHIPARVYLDSAAEDDNTEVNAAMAEALERHGYEHQYVTEAGALHDWPYWAGRFPRLLAYLY